MKTISNLELVIIDEGGFIDNYVRESHPGSYPVFLVPRLVSGYRRCPVWVVSSVESDSTGRLGANGRLGIRSYLTLVELVGLRPQQTMFLNDCLRKTILYPTPTRTDIESAGKCTEGERRNGG